MQALRAVRAIFLSERVRGWAPGINAGAKGSNQGYIGFETCDCLRPFTTRVKLCKVHGALHVIEACVAS